MNRSLLTFKLDGILKPGLIVLVLAFSVPLYAAEPAEPEDVFSMSMEELMNVEIPSSATLTAAEPRLVPAAVTRITEEDIQASGARSLNELLDIYVPNLQWIRNTWEPENLGLRGIVSDRDDKYLLTVNGKVMNDRMHYGVISERDLVLLGDIQYIEIVRGPGSALYGPGAVSMVINIVTHSGLTFQGTEITTRAGAVEEFYSTEIRHGRKFSEDSGLFLYAGIGKYVGASKFDAPVHYGFDFPTISEFDWNESPGAPYLPGDGTAAGEAMTNIAMPRDQAAARGLPPIKLFVQYDEGDWTYWLRYTRGGQAFPWVTGALARVPYGWTDYLRSEQTGNWLPIFPDDWDHATDWGTPKEDEIIWYPEYAGTELEQNLYQYQQLTGYVGYDTSLSDKTDLNLAFSYDVFDYRRRTLNWFNEAYREDEYYGRALLRHKFNDRHKAAIGFEVSHHELGKKAHGWPDIGFQTDSLGTGAGRWSTNLYSVFGEYQWNINQQWTTFIGGRLDDHTYSDRMFSPRASLIYTPSEKDTYKLMWARSVRANFEEEMRAGALNDMSDGNPEILDSVELRYERQHSEHLDLAASLFWHYNLELISYSSTAGAAVPVGIQRNWGLELEAYYHTENTRFGISHGFTKLYDFSLAPEQSTLVTSQAYDSGDDSALWSNHVTKLSVRHKLNDRWTADGSMRIYWGFGGIQDYDKYQLIQDEYYPIDLGWKRGYRGNYYLNLGLQYQPNENTTIRIDGLNLLGIFDKDLNKRNYGASGVFRSHAPAVAFTLVHKF